MFKKNLKIISLFALTLILVALLTLVKNYGFLIALGLVFLLLAAFINLQGLQYGLLLLIFTLPFEYVGALSLSGLPAGFKLRTSMLAGGTLIFFWLLNFLGGQIKARRNYLLPFILIFLATLILSFLEANDLNRSVTVFIYTLFPLALCLLLPQVIVTKAITQKAVYVWLVTAGLVSLFGFFQFFGDLTGLPTTITFLREVYTKRVFGLPRIQGTALEPLLFANYLITPICLAFSLLLSPQKEINKKWLIPLFTLIVLAFIFTMSRGAYLALFFSALLLIIVYYRRFFRLQSILSALAILGIVAFLGWQFINYSDLTVNKIDTIVAHFTNLKRDASNLERFTTYRAAWEIFNDAPIFGIGLGNYGPHLVHYPASPPVSGWPTANNQTLEMLAELGIIGFLAALPIPLRLALGAFRTPKVAGDAFLKAVNIGALAAFLGLLIQWQFFSTLYVIHIWVVMGLLIAVHNLNAKFKNQNAK